jgi:glycosyltransferase involved in cell wall biosynthesis
VDSEVGKADVLQFYADRTTASQVFELPFIPAPYLTKPSPSAQAKVLRGHGIDRPYFLVPAQFWPHKNHVRLVRAVRAAADRGTDVRVVMTGGANSPIMRETRDEVKGLVRSLELQERISFVGLVPDTDMAALYSGSRGVLLPTFFGPTNIPVLEGWALGVPVLTSDIRGIREQCGDAALLVDPSSIDALTDGIVRLWGDEDLRGRLIEAGRIRHESWQPADFRSRIGFILRAVMEGGISNRGQHGG